MDCGLDIWFGEGHQTNYKMDITKTCQTLQSQMFLLLDIWLCAGHWMKLIVEPRCSYKK